MTAAHGRMMVVCVLAVFAGACTPADRTSATGGPASSSSAPEPQGLTAIPLPDLSRLAESVQVEVQARHAALVERLGNGDTPEIEIGQAYGELGLVLMAAEYYEAAESSYLKAHTLAPNVVRWPYYLAHLYRITGEGAKAAEFFERALERQPTDLATLVWLGETYLDQSRPDEAEEVFLDALSLAPRSAAALSGVGRAALARQDAARAAEYLEQALSVEPGGSSLHYPLAMAYRQLGDLERADAHLRQRGAGRATPPDPLMDEYAGLLETPLAYENRGMRALEAGQVATAVEIFREGLERAPDDPALRHRLGTTLFLAGDAREGVEQLEETLRRAPDFVKARFGLGMIHSMNGQPQEAAEHFSAAVRLEPAYLEARLGLAEVLRTTGRAAESVPHYERIVATDPRFAEAWIGLALALAQLERFAEARERLIEASAILPDRPDLADLLARLP